MNDKLDKLCFFVCERYGEELRRVLAGEGFEQARMRILPSACGRPLLSAEELREAVSGATDCEERIVLGGCCLAGIDGAAESNAGMTIRRFPQCFYLFADRLVVDRMQQEGAYLITPGWLARWREHMTHWGFDAASAAEFFSESTTRVVLLDTGTEPGSEEQLRAFARYIKRPHQTVPVGLDPFRLRLESEVWKWRLRTERQRAKNDLVHLREQNADYLMMMDLLGDLVRTATEPDLIRKFLEIFSMLFATQEVIYLPFVKGQAGSPQTLGDIDPSACRAAVEGMLQLQDPYQWTPSGTGFLLRLHRHNELVGCISVDRLRFPEHKERYLNIALSVGMVCGLTVENVRVFERIVATERSLRSNNELLEQQKRDLTSTLEELRATQRHLVEAEKMASLGRLVAGIAHEINTPVSVGIMAASSLMRSTEEVGKLFAERKMTQSDLATYLDDGQEAVDLILNNLVRTRGLIETFKEVAIDPSSEEERVFRLRAYLAHIITTFKSDLDDRGVTVRIDCAEQLCLRNFPGLFAQLLANLVGNSLKHGFAKGAGGVIDIEAKPSKGVLLLIYRDNGRGAPAEVRKKIFDPFYTTNPQQGAGLGMHIAYDIVVQRMKGQIACDQGPEGGLEFQIAFPANKEEHHAS